MSEPILAAEALRYGSRRHFELEVSRLALHPGRIYTLTGPNGSGKTTLLSLLAFLQRPDAGQLRYEGREIRWQHEELLRVRREVTLLHQCPYLFRGTVAENLSIGLKARGLSGVETERRIAEALEALGLAGFRERDARGLSGGEAQRVALARALVLRPRVLLMDEPLSNLDAESAGLLKALIGRLPGLGHAVVISSHHPAGELAGLEIQEIALRGGRVVTAREESVAARPADTRCPETLAACESRPL